VDEYGTEFKIQPKETVEPLSMGELIRLIDGAESDNGRRKGLTSVFRGGGGDLDFVTVSSQFYPELESWYCEEAKEWCEEARRNSRK
jgi:hypothetical protein